MTSAPGYRKAILWIALNIDTQFDNNGNLVPSIRNVGASITVCLVADLFNKTEEEVIKSVKNQLKKISMKKLATLISGDCL